MNLIGFIKEHNNVSNAQRIDMFKKGEFIDPVIHQEIIHYLESGTLLFAWMGYVMDLENGDLIAPDSYYTDGKYVWPAYFGYYLKKYRNSKVSSEFIKHILDKRDIDNKKIDQNLLNRLKMNLLEELQN